MNPLHFARGTWIDSEEVCYPGGGMHRNGRAIMPDGTLRAFRAGIPDTYFTIPAVTRVKGKRVKGWLQLADTSTDAPFLAFHPNKVQP